MSLIKLLISFIEKNNLSYDQIASELGLNEDQLMEMLFEDGDLYLSELDEILDAVGITYSDLTVPLTLAEATKSSKGAITMVLNSNGDDDSNMMKQVLEAIESFDSMIKGTGRSTYMN